MSKALAPQEAVRLSKLLSWILRHGAEKEGLVLDEDGFVALNDVLKLRQFSKYSEDDVKYVVANNDKQRFSLRYDEKLKIRANQGHSLSANIKDEKLLEPITNPLLYPTVIHGTYIKYWDKILTKGLSRMNRRHIHFAIGLPEDQRVKSGLRSNVEVVIYVDLEKAINDGIKFFKSENDVILSPGNQDGYLETKYFKQVLQISPEKRKLL